MAKARTASRQGIVVIQAAAPRRRSAPRRAVRTVKRTARRAAGAYAAASLQTRMQGAAIGGFGVGMVEKTFGAMLPTLPYIGRKGTVALAVYFMKPKTKLIQDIGLAAAALSGYELATQGKISGEDLYDDSQVFTTT